MSLSLDQSGSVSSHHGETAETQWNCIDLSHLPEGFRSHDGPVQYVLIIGGNQNISEKLNFWVKMVEVDASSNEPHMPLYCSRSTPAGKKNILGSFSLPDSASQGWEGRWSQLVQLRKMVFQSSVD